MKYFLLILICIILLSGFTLYIHDTHYTSKGVLEYTDFIDMENQLESRLFNAMVNQYLLTLGEFDLE